MAPAKVQRNQSRSSPGKATSSSRAKRQAATAKAITRKEQLDAFRMMLLIRRFEEKAGQLTQQSKTYDCTAFAKAKVRLPDAL